MTPTSRERIRLALNHEQPDRIPLDLGATPVTGMHVSAVYRLRQALQLDPPGEPVRVANIYQMLGEIKPDLIETLGVDVVGLPRPVNSFGILNQGWKPWVTFDGTPVLVPEGFNTDPEPDGSLLIYPQGDRSAPASGRMPRGGHYFDAIIRQPPFTNDTLNVEDNLEEFTLLNDSDLAFCRAEVEKLRVSFDGAIVINMGGTGFGDVAQVPAVMLKHPKGIRDVTDWYMSLAQRPEFIARIFEKQAEIAIENLRRLYEAIGDQIDIIFMSGTDFAGQSNLLISPKTYRRLFLPYQKMLNDWIHANTGWKSFMHTDGAIRRLIPDFIEAGFDILNPIQWSAADMDPVQLKQEYGSDITFWGGGVDTQQTLPFGTPQEVNEEVLHHLGIFGRDGGYIFSSVHNIQADVPTDNLLAFYQAYRETATRA